MKHAQFHNFCSFCHYKFVTFMDGTHVNRDLVKYTECNRHKNNLIDVFRPDFNQCTFVCTYRSYAELAGDHENVFISLVSPIVL